MMFECLTNDYIFNYYVMKYYFSVNVFMILMLVWQRVDKHPGDQKRLIAYESRVGAFHGICCVAQPVSV